VASLLDQCQLAVGQTGWLHREACDQDTTYPEGSHCRHWQKGCIDEVGTGEFGVKLLRQRRSTRLHASGARTSILRSSMSGQQGLQDTAHYPPIAARSTSWEHLEKAHQTLRCIEWQNITKELMTSAICGTAADKESETHQLFEMSRPRQPGERIDYFMSHSWHDDAEAKWNPLQRLAENFKVQSGSYPTFWFD